MASPSCVASDLNPLKAFMGAGPRVRGILILAPSLAVRCRVVHSCISQDGLPTATHPRDSVLVPDARMHDPAPCECALFPVHPLLGVCVATKAAHEILDSTAHLVCMCHRHEVIAALDRHQSRSGYARSRSH